MMPLSTLARLGEIKTMRKLLLGIVAAGTMGQIVAASNASAADLPMMTKAPVLAPYYDWSGFYVGGEVGGGWSRSQKTVVDGTPAFPAGLVFNPLNASGILGGGYAGYNYQVNRALIIGIDGDYSGADLTGSEATVGPTGVTSTDHGKVGWIATVTGRVGFVVDNNFLIYGKGGWAWAGFSENGVTTSAAGVPVTNLANNDTRNGATVGIGGEWGFAPNWSAKLEYDFVALNTSNFLNTNTTIATGVTTFPARSAGSSLNIVKVGISYRFSPHI
jgi:outer membrane immunogenic protein